MSSEDITEVSINEITSVAIDGDSRVIKVIERETVHQEAPAPPEEIVWPPAVSLARLHKDITFSGTASDVQSVTLTDGKVINKTGSGTIQRTDEGFVFDGDAYFTYSASDDEMSGLAIYAAVTLGGLNDSTNNYIARADGVGFIYVKKSNNRFYARSDIQEYIIDSRIVSGSKLVFGMYADYDYPENGAGFGMWINNMIVGAELGAVTIDNGLIEFGNGFTGTIHELVIFSRLTGGPKMSDVDSLKITNKLMELHNIT
jgi:hypothetical protein